MGNNCVCLNKQNKWENQEIYTPSKTELEPITNLYYNKTFEDFKEQTGNEIVEKSKAAATLAAEYTNKNFLEEIKSSNVKSVEDAFTRDTKAFEPPALRMSYMEFAMDLFDEINKLRANPNLFIGLMEKYPSNKKFFITIIIQNCV